MKYEICKKIGGTWTAVAWTDTWGWAEKIRDSLNCVSEGEFKVLRDGKIIKNLEEAMRR